MRRVNKRTFEELVRENKSKLLEDQQEIERIELAIEERLEKRMLEKAE
ncbi:FbpB family small basic protein [Priestia flexa]|jgi:Fur-regulated basic protein B|uniref:FbpB family small basic protein n=1 Tax=Priestia flexa TaxID=86664 RepID=A0A1N6VDR5_9BACI|nr:MULTISPECIES: FbpB family small basic protein [Bacillaceae]MBN8251331.1 FbpB family small basic protein [Priestia flexa]MBN8434406.1 FbpB family small basic protein [Priestia flexa]MBY6086407.1 FbpB family small basic protein [Priestia flexa]MCA0966810.1 FbpB family small basic protein [Priestia flexa]MCA1202639.1 FbpB family small basic protein [Priestia flexa]